MDGRTKGVLAVVLVVAAIASVYFALSGASQRIDVGPYEVLGAITAEETCKLVGKGRVLLMIPDSGTYKNPSVESQVKAFRDRLKKHPGLELVIEKVSVTAMLMLATGGGVPADQLFKALQGRGKLDVVVLFFRFPQLTGPELARLKGYAVKTVVVSSYYPDYKELLRQQIVQLAIVPRMDGPPAEGTTARTVRERFDQEFMALTVAEAERLP